jgi:hypothetical protein
MSFWDRRDQHDAIVFHGSAIRVWIPALRAPVPTGGMAVVAAPL